MTKLILFILLTVSLYASDARSKIDHIIVVYLENRSFDNLFRGFEGADTSDKPFQPYALQTDSQWHRLSHPFLWEKRRKY